MKHAKQSILETEKTFVLQQSNARLNAVFTYLSTGSVEGIYIRSVRDMELIMQSWMDKKVYVAAILVSQEPLPSMADIYT